MAKLLVLKILSLCPPVIGGGGAATSQIYTRLHFLQFLPFSSSVKSTQRSSNRSLFAVNYLINSCGFTPEKALSASNYVKFEVADKPECVITFFRDQGFTQTQISNLVKGFPPVILSNPEKTLLPKLEFFKSRGISDPDVAAILSRSPMILGRSLENQLIPTFNFLSNFLHSDENATATIKRFGGILSFDLETYVLPNIEMLKASGMPMKNIEYVLTRQPRMLMTTCDKFRLVVEEVKKMGFNPSGAGFWSAIHVLRSMSKSTWDTKVEVYKKWGWSEGDIFTAFRKYPWCMSLSEAKITLMMEYWVKMGWKSSVLAHRPQLLALSFKKRIKPRCEIYQALMSKGIVDPESHICFGTLLESSDKHFVERFIGRYNKEVPELLNLYKEKLKLAK